MRLVDLHCDTVMKFMKDADRAELKKNKFCVDIDKLREGDSLAQFFALFVYLNGEYDAFERCNEMLDKFYSEIDRNRDSIALALNYEDVMANKDNGKISAFLTIEEGGVLKGKIHNLRNFYRLGVRLITLTWNFPNELGYPNFRWEYKDKGLTEFGHEIVDEMNKLGMIIDVSHLSDGGFYDVAKFSNKPFVASHSNAREIRNHPRNLTDEMIRILSDKGGVMGLNFESSFLGEPETGTVEDMVRHIKHIRNIGGIQVISIGSDFDGTSHNSEIENIGQMDKLSNKLVKEGFSEDEIEMIYYKNALRVIKEVL